MSDQHRTIAENLTRVGAVCATIGLAVTACSSLPERVDTLEQARAQVQTLEQDSLARDAAGPELDAARREIKAADDAYASKEDIEIIQHQAYMAKQHAGIAEQQIAQAHAQQSLKEGQRERDQIRLQAREEEARQARAETESLQKRLDDLQAKKTDQGLVLTLGNVLFDTNRAELNPGAMPTVDRLAAFLHDYPMRRVLIEGYTDSRGSDSYNLALSQQRADAVADALRNAGVDGQRVRLQGLGEAYPVASNDTAAGMQQNRRVEVVISNEDGDFPPAAEQRIGGVSSFGGFDAEGAGPRTADR